MLSIIDTFYFRLFDLIFYEVQVFKIQDPKNTYRLFQKERTFSLSLLKENTQRSQKNRVRVLISLWISAENIGNENEYKL